MSVVESGGGVQGNKLSKIWPWPMGPKVLMDSSKERCTGIVRAACLTFPASSALFPSQPLQDMRRSCFKGSIRVKRKKNQKEREKLKKALIVPL